MTKETEIFFSDWKDADGSSLSEQEKKMLGERNAVLHKTSQMPNVKIFVEFEGGKRKSKIVNRGRESQFAKLCAGLESAGFIVPFKPNLTLCKSSTTNQKG